MTKPQVDSRHSLQNKPNFRHHFKADRQRPTSWSACLRSNRPDICARTPCRRASARLARLQNEPNFPYHFEAVSPRHDRNSEGQPAHRQNGGGPGVRLNHQSRSGENNQRLLRTNPVRLDKVASNNNPLMMRSVGIKLLKNKLSEYVRLAAGGETILVTDRDHRPRENP
jgi:hypothetical protein